MKWGKIMKRIVILLKKNVIVSIMALTIIVGAIINASASGSSTVSLSSSDNYADSGVVSRSSGESVVFNGKVLSSSTKNGTFVARYNRNGSYYNDYSTAQKGIKPGKSCPSSQATTGHTHYILRIVSGNDTNGFFNSGTIATGKIKAS
jgi:hypothetical protein